MGITPAHAGKSGTFGFLIIHRRDHPRTRGEKPAAEEGGAEDEGSPPHTRGKDSVSLGGLAMTRITPAHAGKSQNQQQSQT